ncbi:endonuclease/exonuclease/phosphatase family protein [soil metagenome]
MVLKSIAGFSIPSGKAASDPVSRVARALALGLGLTTIAGTLLSLNPRPSWVFRIWDFPRLQLFAGALTAGAMFGSARTPRSAADLAFIGSLGITALIQGRKIAVYTPFWPVQVERSAKGGSDEARLRILVTNVLRENSCYQKLVNMIREHEPDVVLAVEVDGRWERELEGLAEDYPYIVRQPQENHFGMMLFSRLPLEDTRVEFLVQDDIPSVRTRIVLRSGDRVQLHGLHPRPPEPQHLQDSTPRDAELVMVGREIGESEEQPTIVAGDLNDVAWSRTTQLFLRLSGLLDPRIGRGFYNSFNANQPLMRWPLDHIFHSRHFRLVSLRRLGKIGSDHFPMLAELSYQPEALLSQNAPEADPEDRRAAKKRVRMQRIEAGSGETRPSE